MLTVAVIHRDAEKGRALAQRLALSASNLRVPMKIAFSSDPSTTASSGAPGAAPVDVVFLDASVDGLVESAGGPNQELVLLDATHERLLELLRRKPVAALSVDEDDPLALRDALTIALAYARSRRATPRLFNVHTKTRDLRVPYDAILFFESSRRRVILHTTGENDLVSFSATLDSVEKSLPPGLFVRCHQSYLVNAAEVSGVNRASRSLVLTDGESVSVSDRYYKKMVDLFSGGGRREARPSSQGEAKR